jgi:hypothetical protein
MLPQVSGDFCLGIASGSLAVILLTAFVQYGREYAKTYTVGVLVSTAAIFYGATVAPDGPELLRPPATAPEKPPKPPQRSRTVRPRPFPEEREA